MEYFKTCLEAGIEDLRGTEKISELFSIFLHRTVNHLQGSASKIPILDCMSLFLQAGANPNIKVLSRPLLSIILEKTDWFDIQILKSGSSLLKLLISLVHEAFFRSDGNTPLHVVLARQHKCAWEAKHIKVVANLILERTTDTNCLNQSGEAPLEVLLRYGPSKYDIAWSSEIVELSLRLIHLGAFTTSYTTLKRSLIELSDNVHGKLSRKLRCAMLKADTKAQPPLSICPPWVEYWRKCFEGTSWEGVKACFELVKICPLKPKIPSFDQDAYICLAEGFLDSLLSKIRAWREREGSLEDAKRCRKEYKAVLSDCLKNKIEIDASYFHSLLDIMDLEMEMATE